MQNTLRWFSAAIAANIGKDELKQVQGMFQNTEWSSDGFCYNVLTVLLNLCDYYTDPAHEAAACPYIHNV